MGIFITVSALSIQPMLQQSIRYPMRDVDAGTASLLRGIGYNQGSARREDGKLDICKFSLLHMQIRIYNRSTVLFHL